MSAARAALYAALLAFAALAAHASSWLRLDTDALVTSADLVARGHVISSEARWLEQEGPSRIVTFHHVTLAEVLKGALTPSEANARALIVGTPGGVVGELGQRVHGAPRLSPGDEVVLFLGPARGPGGARGVVGLSQGALHVGAPGGMLRLPAVDGAEHGPPPAPRPATLEELRALVSRGTRR